MPEMAPNTQSYNVIDFECLAPGTPQHFLDKSSFANMLPFRATAFSREQPRGSLVRSPALSYNNFRKQNLSC